MVVDLLLSNWSERANKNQHFMLNPYGLTDSSHLLSLGFRYPSLNGLRVRLQATSDSKRFNCKLNARRETWHSAKLKNTLFRSSGS